MAAGARPGRGASPAGVAARQLRGRIGSLACFAAAAAAAPAAFAAAPPYRAAWAVCAALAIWWSAPRARAPLAAEFAVFGVAAIALGAGLPWPAAWTLPAAGIAVALPLVTTRPAAVFAAATGAGVVAASALWQLARAAPHQTPAGLLGLALGLAAGAAVGLWLREQRARQEERAALQAVAYRAESDAEHTRFLLRTARAGLQAPAGSPGRAAALAATERSRGPRRRDPATDDQ